MRIAALLSGGKDSVYSAHLVEGEGEELVSFVTVHPRRTDSYMFHTVNLQVTELQAKSWGKPIVSRASSGVKEEELEDLKQVLSHLDIEGVVSGAIASNYQRERIERICQELELISLTPLWGRKRNSLLEEMIRSGMNIIVTAVAAMGLDESWLGKKLDRDAYEDLLSLSKEFGIDVCGEGGEYETLVLDAPWFQYPIEIIEYEKNWDGMRGTYTVKRMELTHPDT